MQINQVQFVKSSVKLSQCPIPDLPEFAFVGRSNVGKSSLINMLTNNQKLAKVSSTPGKTQTINHFKINNLWYLVDLPGYGYAKVAKTKREVWSGFISDYILNRPNLMNLYVLVDIRHDPQKIDLAFFEKLAENQIPFSIIFTKKDKLTKNKATQNLDNYKKTLTESWDELPPIFVSSSVENIGRIEILNDIDQISMMFKK